MARKVFFGRRVTQTLLIVLLAAQAMLAVNACVLPMTDVAMPYAAADMPAPCLPFNKNACLLTSHLSAG